jgi:hypothetical protein
MKVLSLFFGGTAIATSGSNWNVALGALASTGLPIFVIILLGQRATAAFYRGWRPGGGVSPSRRFRISGLWRTIFIFFNMLLFAAALLSWFRSPPIVVLALFGSIVCLGFTFLLIVLFRFFVEITPDELVIRDVVKTHRVKMASINRAYAASFLLLLELKEGRTIPLPLICLENVSELASCLYENLHKP